MAVRKLTHRVKHAGPEIALALFVIFAGVSVWQAWAVANHLRDEARETSRIYGRITAALADPDPGADTETLFRLVTDIRATGIPMVMTDTAGRPTAWDNVPTADSLDHTAVLAHVRALDRANPPITVPGVGTLHFGALPAARRLTSLALLQLALLGVVITVGIWAYRSAITRARDHVWLGMARESAHQLGTPLMSAAAWVDRLDDNTTPPTEIAGHLRADLERLQRVAQRFERIGRPARRDRVGLGALAERVAAYFEPRLPRHANPVRLSVHAPSAGPMIAADAVLLEWALEALVRNSIDALSGQGGTIEINVTVQGELATIRVQDNGPGIPPEIRAKLFEPGVSTKPGGWGIGLALARRIFEDVHGGRIEVGPSTDGAVLVAELPIAPEAEESD